jgi:H2-forming N5,N10-methylenetetrahydromethanopterin dehydrogenase-like enzyme
MDKPGMTQIEKVVLDAIHDGVVNHKLLSDESTRIAPELTHSDANKVFVIPSEFTQAVADIGAGAGRPGGARPDGSKATLTAPDATKSAG